jgi:acyl carrier protein
MQQSLEDQLKHLIVDALALEDVEASEIKTDEPLFVDGLGLDSIDALELALAIQEKFGVATSPDDERNREIFYSVKTLAEFVRGVTGASPAAAAATT